MAYETTTELRDLLAEEVGDTSASTSTLTRFVGLLDRAHKTILSGGGELNMDQRGNPIRRPFLFPWALSSTPIIVNTVAPITAGTASITKDSTSVTMSTSVTPDVANWFIRFNSEEELYRVATHGGSSTAITLDAACVNTTDTAATYTLFKLDYDFGDGSSTKILLPSDSVRAYQSDIGGQAKLSIVDLNELSDRYPLFDTSQASPRLLGLVKQGDYSLNLRLSHYPESLERMELQYIPAPTELDTSSENPLIPKHHRTVLVHLAAFYHLRKRDDDRASSHLKSAQNLFDAMIAEARQTYGGQDEKFGHVSPWPGGFPKNWRSVNIEDPY